MSLSQHRLVSRQLLHRLLDGASTAGAVVGAAHLLVPLPLMWGEAVVQVLLALLATHLAFGVSGAYGTLRDGPLADRLGSQLLGGLGLLIGFQILAWAGLAATSPWFAPSYVAAWVLMASAGSAAGRVGLFALEAYGGRRGEEVVLLGDWPLCAAMARHLATNPRFGLRVIAILTDLKAESQTSAHLSGRLRRHVDIDEQEKLAEIVAERHPAHVIICGALDSRELIDRALIALRDSSVQIQFCPDLSSLPVFCLQARELADRPMIDLSGPPWSDRAVLLKAIEDKILASIALVLFAVPMLLIAAAIKLTSPGPVFFIQDRHGLGGRHIRVFKFRTMRHQPQPAAPVTVALERRHPVGSESDSGPQLALAGFGALDPSTSARLRQRCTSQPCNRSRPGTSPAASASSPRADGRNCPAALSATWMSAATTNRSTIRLPTVVACRVPTSPVPAPVRSVIRLRPPCCRPRPASNRRPATILASPVSDASCAPPRLMSCRNC